MFRMGNHPAEQKISQAGLWGWPLHLIPEIWPIHPTQLKKQHHSNHLKDLRQVGHVQGDVGGHLSDEQFHLRFFRPSQMLQRDSTCHLLNVLPGDGTGVFGLQYRECRERVPDPHSGYGPNVEPLGKNLLKNGGRPLEIPETRLEEYPHHRCCPISTPGYGP